MAWFGVIRDSEAIAEWQRLGASALEDDDPQRRVAERLGRWLALPAIATAGVVLAIIPGAIVPASDAAEASSSSSAVVAVAAAGDAYTPPEDLLPRAEGLGPLLAAGSFTSSASAVARVDPAAAAAEVERLSGVHGPAGELDDSGIPVTVLAAYKKAEAELAVSDPSCHLPWWLLAGIGRIESGQAAGGRVTADGTTRGTILGVRLDGSLPGTAVIRDTDGGALDGDPLYDRAVGPMQFLPSTWRIWGRDGNGDGVRDPNNIFDAALGAGAYLCAGGRDLSTSAGIAAAVLSYNNSVDYLTSVVTWGMAYRDGVTPIDDGSGTVPPPPTVAPTTSPSSTTMSTTTTTKPPTSAPPSTTPPTSAPPSTTSSTSPTSSSGSTSTSAPPTSSSPSTSTSTTSTSSPTSDPTTPPTCSTTTTTASPGGGTPDPTCTSTSSTGP